AAASMRQKYPRLPFFELARDRVDILVAGCGTGQHPIELALRLKDADVLAIDLSLASLAYAQRQSEALGLNIRYAQADILRLADTGLHFDLIESSGVLHHMADPFAGWRALLSMLRPGGVMQVGLYSTTARRDIAAARALIAERGYGPTPED